MLNTFGEALEDAKKENQKIGLLLGNGFSQECCFVNNFSDQKSFSYVSLLEIVSKQNITSSVTVGELFDILETKDFEHVLRKLNDAKICQNITRLFHGRKDADFHSVCDHAISKVRESLIDAIRKMHPDHQYERISKVSYKACADFIRNFDRVFTVNYDLLLYWAQMNDKELSDDFADCFCNKINEKIFFDSKLCANIFSRKNTLPHPIYYLHGALHLFTQLEQNEVPYKITAPQEEGKHLLENIKNEVKKNCLPLYVSEGEASHKLSVIYNNPYLKRCYDALLNKMEGVIFTYGISFEHDEHIINALKGNKRLKKIYLGVYDEKPAYFNKLREKFGKGDEVILYDSRDVYPWGKGEHS